MIQRLKNYKILLDIEELDLIGFLMFLGKKHHSLTTRQYEVYYQITNKFMDVDEFKDVTGEKMVERSESQGFEEFEGIVDEVEEVENTLADFENAKQIHIAIKPTSVEVGGKTNHMHEWIGLPKSATEKSIPTGCVADRYLQEIETVITAAKKETTVISAFTLLQGKKLKFVKKTLGKPFGGKPAKAYWVPVQLLE